MIFLRKFFKKYNGLILQTDPRLIKPIRQWGCNFRCHLAMAEIYVGKVLDVDEINEAYYKLSENPDVMDKDCTLGYKLQYIIDWALLKLGKAGFGYQIGGKVDGEDFNFWYGDKNIVDFTLLHGVTEKGNSHYRLGKGLTDKVWFDPWPGTKIKQEYGRLFYHIREA